MATITSANSIYMLSIIGLFGTPVQLQGFAADDVFDTEGIESAEAVMGVDGFLSAGFVYVPIKQSISLQADSPSCFMFEEWYAKQQANREVFRATAQIMLPSVGKNYACSNGVLTHYSLMSDAKKVLQPRKFSITWQSVVGAPI